MFLSSCGFVHRDIACRNILVFGNEGEETYKICDFGLITRKKLLDEIPDEDEDVETGDLPLPIIITPPIVFRIPEVNHFSQQTDIWSFGVLIWEIFVNGTKPWIKSKSYKNHNEKINMNEILGLKKKNTI